LPAPIATLLITTLPDEGSAVKLAESLLQQRLAACVHRFPAGVSMYRWEGRIETAHEYTVMVKSTDRSLEKLAAAVRELHPYEVPEILAFRASHTDSAYMHWLADETNPEAASSA
jgi:periplasmic divalent cation tolerance protein